MMRIALFLLTNVAIMVVMSFFISVFGADKYLSSNGIDYGTLLVFSAIIGFSGSIISLLLSKQMAKISVGARVIENPTNSEEAWLIDTVERLSRKAGIKMPEVALFEDSSPNAFATGAFRDDALVAVSRGLINHMNEHEIEAVLSHEIGHIANGDMVTLTLLQGVVNTFVVFFARIIGYFVDRVLLKNKGDEVGIGYTIASIVAEIVLGILASMIVFSFSRYREYRADEAGARLSSTYNMIAALEALKRAKEEPNLPDGVKAFGINGKSLVELFSTHPTLESRIENLKKYTRS